MSDHHAEAAVAQLLGGGVEVFAHGLEGCLHQQPASPWRALGDRLEVLLGQPSDHVVAKLPAAAQEDRQTRRVDRRLQLADAVAEVRHVREEVAADVRRRDHGAGAFGSRSAEEVDALVDRVGAVVNPGQRVEVQLYSVHCVVGCAPKTGIASSAGYDRVALL